MRDAILLHFQLKLDAQWGIFLWNLRGGRKKCNTCTLKCLILFWNQNGSLYINSSTTILAQICESDQRTCPKVKVSTLNLERILLGWPGSESIIKDHSDHDSSKEPMSPP